MEKNKTVVLDLSGNFFRNPYLNNFVKVLIGVALFYLVITNANFVTYETKIDIVLFAVTHMLVEIILVRYTYRYLTKYIIMSFGTILILPITLAATVAYIVNQPFIMFPSTETFLGFIVIFMTARKIITVLLQGFIKRRRYEKLLAERVKNNV